MQDGREELTQLEIKILGLAASGLSTKLIARELGNATSTISNHLNTIYLKLGAANRAEAVAIAIRLGVYLRPTLDFVSH